MTTKTKEPQTIGERLERLERLVLPEEAVPGLRQHLMNLYRHEDGTLDEHGAVTWDNPSILRSCAEAIQHARAGNKGEWVKVTYGSGTERAACEVVAYYELEEFVTSGAGNQTK